MVLLERRFFSDDRVTIDDGWNPTNTISESRGMYPHHFFQGFETHTSFPAQAGF